ncbi:AAA family ATPase [Vallitalea pronyensis]|uniref:AAA family ATPase n=1 Tax=Vallitalea pronyensis TaxID=1348613 RepID=A0A8J8SEZ3_9FIRM|nr:AAA family ATPase [Vallitalea pronyensis]QUI20892.1 AAA family ATPase [Vallitalea pronyensis]
MYLYNLKLWNFRKYGSNGDLDLDKPDLDICFNKGLNLVIGENDSGKTGIIDAIKIVLKTSSYDWIRIVDNDFYKSSDELRIELKFRGLSEEEAKNFVEFLSREEFSDEFEPILNVIYRVYKKDGKILPSDVRAGSDKIGKVLPAEAREFLKVTYLKPLRDVQSELIPKRNSRLSQIFQGHEAFKGVDEHLLLKIYESFNKSIRLYFEGKDNNGKTLIPDQNGKILKNNIDKTIKGFFNKDSESIIDTTKAEIKKILESLELSLNGINNPGLGSLNRLFMASELIHLNKQDWTGLRLGLIEEIEAHLHPQVQLKVIKNLIKQKNTQLILTSHSPNLASKVPLENQIICRNNFAYALSSKFTNLDKRNYVFLEKFLDVTKSNLLFAKGLILVEGWSEELIIPVIADKIGYNLVDNEVSIINVGNLGFSNYYKIFSRKDNRKMGIHISVITDCDMPAYQEDINNSKKVYTKINNDIYKLNCQEAVIQKQNNYEEPAKLFIAKEWTLEWCLMKSIVIGETFRRITKNVHNKSNWTDFENQLAEKLLKKSLKKSEIAFRLATAIEKNDISINLNQLESDDTMKHIVEAIIYASK